MFIRNDKEKNAITCKFDRYQNIDKKLKTKKKIVQKIDPKIIKKVNFPVLVTFYDEKLSQCKTHRKNNPPNYLSPKIQIPRGG